MNTIWALVNIYLVVEGINYMEYLMQKKKLDNVNLKKFNKKN